MLDALAPYFAWDLSRWEAYGLFFLLGSFVVATVSDLKHLSAQREFMDVWWAFAGILVAIQAWQADLRPSAPLVVKWVLLVVLALASHRSVGLTHRLATADVAAIAAATSLLSPGLILVFHIALKLAAWPASRILARGRPAYPFMPVITAATLVPLGVAVGTGLLG